MLPTELPTRPEDFSVDILNRIIANHRPDAMLCGFEITENHIWGGGQASSAGRVIIKPNYVKPAQDLPEHIVIKVAKAVPGTDVDDSKGGSGSPQLYSNEVNVYTHLRPAEFMETPLCFGGAFDANTTTFCLLLEDLRDRDATFATIKMPMTIPRMESLIEALSSLHARFWNSPEFGKSLGWMESHVEGSLHDLFTSDHVRKFVQHQVDTEQYKEEMVQALGVTPGQLHKQFQIAQAHQATQPRTVCHGDMHIGNTYMLPDEKAGVLDWQLTSRGHGIHDISYIITTGLSVDGRRKHERDLLSFYRDRLIAKGVKDAPSLDDLWREHRIAMAWNFYIGWLITPTMNYQWDITVMAHLRLMTAYQDLETAKAISAIRL